jgi:proteasome assembly chaperone (PAC2) family protein
MAETLPLNRPWMVAVWPGMGHVAHNAGVYLLSKLQMGVFAELEAADLFDVDHVEVRKGILRAARRPRNRFFAWRDPKGRRDLVVFLGEAQPPVGRYPFCRHVVQFAKRLGVERVVTFAAMATPMRPEDRSRLFVAATDKETLGELRSLGPEIVEDGQISGLNGVLLGVAAQEGLRGACLLGEMPQVFAQLPFPKASLSVLEAFSVWAAIELDLGELEKMAQASGENLGELLARVEEVAEGTLEEGEGKGKEEEESEFGADDETQDEPEEAEEEQVGGADRRRIEDLFTRAEADRSKAFELKRELDRLGAFRDYEDRFLDLFKKSG